MKKFFIALSFLLNLLVIAAGVFIWSVKDRFMSGVVAPHAERQKTQFELLSDKRVDVVFLGDSLTEGGKWHEFFPDVDVVNRGVSGDTSADVLNRIDQVVSLRPGKLFIMVGINDLNRMLGKKETASNYTALFDRIDSQLPDTKVYLQSVLPVNDQWAFADNAKVPDINVLLKSQAENRGYHYLDLHRVFANQRGKLRQELSNDGIHLLGKGYALWTSEVETYVRQ